MIINIYRIFLRFKFYFLLLKYRNTIFNRVFTKTMLSEKDVFPSLNQWKQEISKWLVYMKSRDQLERFIPRLNSSPKNRDETLTEIFAAYLLEIKFKFRIIAWEVETLDNKNVEFVINSKYGNIYCDVKSPQWEGELFESERLSGRKKAPKYINAEVRNYSNRDKVQYAIDKAYPKFNPEFKNLLIINDNLFVNLLDSIDNIEDALYSREGGYFSCSKYKKLSGLLVINCFFSDSIQYHCKYFKNDYSIKELTINLY